MKRERRKADMEGDIIVADENFQIASNVIKNYGNFLFSNLKIYKWILDQVLEQSIKDQEISAVLRRIRGGLEEIAETVKDASDKIGQCSLDFVKNVDETDQFLYGE